MDTSVKNIAPTGRISAELPCVKCAFILRGLPVSGRCPECGEAIRVTLGATVLDEPDYARRGLEDLGTSLKFSIPALLGLLAWAILGPFIAVLAAGASYLRVSALERLRRAGAFESPPLRPTLRLARQLAWVSAIFGSIAAVCILHDAIGKWGQWLSPRWAISLAWMWTFLIWAEAILAAMLLRRSAIILQVGWLLHAARISFWLVAGGVFVSVVAMPLGAAIDLSRAGQILLLVAIVLLSWLPLMVGGWTVGACIQQVAGAAIELHWLATSGEGLIEHSPADDSRGYRRRNDATEPTGSAPPAVTTTTRPPSDDEPIPLD